MKKRREPPIDMSALRLSAKKEVAKSYAASLMASTKWRTVFEVLEAADIDVKGVAVKFVGNDKEWSPVFPRLYPPHDYIEFWPLNIYPLVEIE